MNGPGCPHDNTAVVEILNKGRSCSPAIMQFLTLTLSQFDHPRSFYKGIRSWTIPTYQAGISFFVRLATGQHWPSIFHPHVTMSIKGRSSLLNACHSPQTFTASVSRPAWQTTFIFILALHMNSSIRKIRIHFAAMLFFTNYKSRSSTQSEFCGVPPSGILQ